MGFEVLTAVEIQVKVFRLWWCAMVGYHRFGGPHCLCPEDGGIKVLQNSWILLQHHTASQPRRPGLEMQRLLARNLWKCIKAQMYSCAWCNT